MNEEIQNLIDSLKSKGATPEEIAVVVKAHHEGKDEFDFSDVVEEFDFSDVTSDKPSFLENVAEGVNTYNRGLTGDQLGATLGGFNRGISQVVTAPLILEGALEQTLGIKNPIQGGLEATGLIEESEPWALQMGQGIQNFMEEQNPRYENVSPTLQSVTEGLGQGVGMIATAGASTPAQGLNLIPTATQIIGKTLTSPATMLGGAMTAAPEWEAAKESGLSDDEAFEVLLKNYLVGQTEALPVQNLLTRLNKATGNQLLNTVKAQGIGGVEEFLQEGLQTYLTNEVAKDTYDPDRDPLFQVLESAKVGGIVGFLLPGFTSVAQNLPAEKRVRLERKLGELQINSELPSSGDQQLDAELDAIANIDPVDKQVLEEIKVAKAEQQEQKEVEAKEKLEEALQKPENEGTESTENEKKLKPSETPEYKQAIAEVERLQKKFAELPITENADELLFELRNAREALRRIAPVNSATKKSEIKSRIEDTTGITPQEKIKITPAAALKNQIQTFYRGMEKGVKKGKELTNELVSKVQEAIKEQPLNSQQASQILTKVRKTNLFTPGSVSRLNDFIDKVSTDARYAEDLSNSETLRDRIKKKSKTKVESIPRNYKQIAKDFARIKPEDTDLKEYQDLASQVLGGFADPKTPQYSPINVLKVKQYVDRVAAESQANEIKRVRDEYGFGEEFSDEDIDLFINSEDIDQDEFYQNKEETKKKIIRDKILKTAEFAQTGLQDYQSEEPIVENLKKAPLNELSDGQLVEYVRTVDNIVENDDFSNAERINAQVEAVEAADKLLEQLKGKKLGELGVVKGAVYNVPMMFNAIYSNSELAAKVQLYSGLQDVYNGGSRVESSEHVLYEDFQKEAKRLKQKYGKTPLDAERQVRIGVFATLVRHPKGEQADIPQSKNIISESIRRLKNKPERKEIALDAEKAFSHFKDATTPQEVFDIMKKVDPMGLEMWQFFNKEFDIKVKGRLKKNAEQIFNEEFVEEENYTPKVFETVDAATAGELDAQRAFTSDLPNKPKQSKTAIRATNTLPAGRALNFEFYNNMFRKYRESVYDIETSKPRLLFREFMRLPKAQEVLGGPENKQRLAETYRKSEEVQRGIGRDYSDLSKFLDEMTGALRTLGYTAALGSVDQVVKQYVPVAMNTMWNLGTDSDLFFSHIPDGTEKLFNMYTIGQRGRRLGGAERGEAIKHKMQSAYRNWALKGINKFHNLTEKGAQIFMYSLTKGDVSVAQRSWVSYYLKYLKDKGVDLKTVDLSKESALQNDPIRREAASYAEQKVKETQVVSNPSELAKLLRTAPGAENWIKNIFIPFSTFSVNTKVRLIENIRQLRTNENKAEAYRALAGTVSEVALYSTIKYYLIAQIYDLLKSGIEDFFGIEGDEPDEAFRFKQWYSDIVKNFLPTAIGTMGESKSVWAANAISYLIQNPDMTYQEWLKETKGGTFYQYKGDSQSFDLGLYSVGLDRVQEAVRDTEASATGDTTLSLKWGDKDVTLSEDQKRFMAFMTALDWLSVSGFMDSGIYNTFRKIRDQQLKKGDSQNRGRIPNRINRPRITK